MWAAAPDRRAAGGRPDVDVLIAGAGAAGLAAALAAAPDASVLLVEGNRNFRRACNTVLSTSMIPAGGSRWQRSAGIADSPERFLTDVMAKTHGTARRDVAEALTRVAPALVAWLADTAGVALELVTDFDYPGHSVRRCHAVRDRSGASLHRALLDAVRKVPAVTFEMPCRITDLLTDGADSVTGAVVQTPDGAQEAVTAHAVVLATNGFAANREMVAEHLPEIRNALYFGGEASTGDALRLGERVGADVVDLDAYQGHGSVAVPQGVLLTWATVMHGGVLVNARGHRFGDESRGYSEFGQVVLAQPDGIAWAVYDTAVDRLCRSFADYRLCLETGAVRQARDVDELVTITGAPREALAATLDSIARTGAGGGDEFGRTWWPRGLEAPYLAVKVTGALFHTQGGLGVDGHARVLRGGRPIPGLYAAGGAAVGISGHGADGYLAGNGLLAALGLGYLAGRAAAADRVQR
ncbi:MAG: FAD-binding protein [Jatrophihabitans sp.]|nr:MAG: FAD-binding protein [Jatrophihabitans sp.]